MFKILKKLVPLVINNHVPFTFKAARKKQEKQEPEEIMKKTVAKERTENIKSPHRKRCKTLSTSSVGSTG